MTPATAGAHGKGRATARPLLRSGRAAQAHQRGFTLVEIAVTLVLIGILAAFVLPRFIGRGGYEARTAQDQIISAARYAQQLAMLKGTGANVRFVLNNGSYHIEVAGAPVILPGGSATSRTLSGVSTSSVTLSYTPLGDTTPSTLTVSDGESTRKVCVSATGYAHAC